jgi:hypothetical protein
MQIKKATGSSSPKAGGPAIYIWRAAELSDRQLCKCTHFLPFVPIVFFAAMARA